jgi:hypothetical protein
MKDKTIEEELRFLLDKHEAKDLDFIQVVALLGEKEEEVAGFVSFMKFPNQKKCDLNRMLITYFYMRNNARSLREMIRATCGKRPEDFEYIFADILKRM